MSEPSSEQVAERLARVQKRIAATGADPAGIEIVAVTKGHGTAACRAALGAGLVTLGENRVQEALPKMDSVPEARWHLLGHLQTNKVRHAGRFALLQSLDSERLIDALASRAPEVPVLIEVNVSRERQKHGVEPELAIALAEQTAARLTVRGLMTIAPLGRDPRPAFRELRELRERIQDHLGRALPTLSMGMSGDFEVAVQEGATMVRLGTVLFGERA